MKAVQNLYPNPQKFVNMLPETDGDSWGALIPKSLASGALSISDIPKILEIPHNLKHGEDHPSSVKAKDTLKKLDPRTSYYMTIFHLAFSGG